MDKVRVQNFLFFSALILFFLGLLGLIIGLFSLDNREEQPRTPQKFPLGGVKGIAVDDSGRIYCGSNFYGQVQVYDSNGRFLYALKVGRVQDIYFDENQNLMVQTLNDSLYIFNQHGILISKGKHEAEDGDHLGKRVNYDEFGNQYRIKSGELFPQIILIKPNGKEKVIIANSFWEWWLAGPIPALPFFLMGFLILFFLLKIPSELIFARKKQWEARRSGKPMIEV